MQVSHRPIEAKWRTVFARHGLGLGMAAGSLLLLAACSNPAGWVNDIGGSNDSDSPLPPPLIADEDGVVADPSERKKAAQVPTGLRAATPPSPQDEDDTEQSGPQYTDDNLRGGRMAAAAPPRVVPPAPAPNRQANTVPAVPQPSVQQESIAPPAALAQDVPPPPTFEAPAAVPPSRALQTPPPPIAKAEQPPAPASRVPALQTAPPAPIGRNTVASNIPEPAPLLPVPPAAQVTAPAPVQRLPGYPPASGYGSTTPPQAMPLPHSAPIAQSGLAPQPPRPMQMPPPVTAMQVPPLGTPEAQTLPPALTPAPLQQAAPQSTMAPPPTGQWQQPAPSQPHAVQPGWQMAGQPSLSQFIGVPSGLIETIYFKSGSANLDNRDWQKIRAAAAKYNQRGRGIIRILGHASSRTQNMPEVQQMVTNWRISQKRAAAVADALIRAGVAPDAIVVEAVSDAEPIYVESLPAGEAGNRRAEIYLE